MKLYKLEAVRGFAAIYVVFHHVLPHDLKLMNLGVGNIFRFGQEAVILFFLLSGFVINYSYTRSADKSFKGYFLKRFTRIYIPLFFVFALGYFFEVMNAGKWLDPQLSNLAGNVFMLQDAGALKPGVLVEPYMHNSPLWSLSYEWWFYMLFYPIVKFATAKKQRDNFVFMAAVASSAVYIYEPAFIVRLLMYFSIWWVGVVLSDMYIEGKQITLPSLRGPFIGLAAISFFLLISVLLDWKAGLLRGVGLHPLLELRHMIFSIIVIVAAVVWRRSDWVGFDLLFKPFLWVAPLSYVIYISHIYLMAKASYLHAVSNLYLEYVSYFLIMLVFSYVLELRLYPSLRTIVYKVFGASK